MSQSDDSWLPRFERRDDYYVVVHYYGREWFLTTPLGVTHPNQLYAYDGFRPSYTIGLSFEMALIPPPPDLSIPDNIILGDN